MRSVYESRHAGWRTGLHPSGCCASSEHAVCQRDGRTCTRASRAPGIGRRAGPRTATSGALRCRARRFGASTLRDASEGRAYGPKIRGVQVVARVVVPAIARYEFVDARVSATSSSVLLRDRVVAERVPGVDASRGNYASGHVLAHGWRTAIV